jgi:hypothetical protein
LERAIIPDEKVGGIQAFYRPASFGCDGHRDHDFVRVRPELRVVLCNHGRDGCNG